MRPNDTPQDHTDSEPRRHPREDGSRRGWVGPRLRSFKFEQSEVFSQRILAPKCLCMLNPDASDKRV